MIRKYKKHASEFDIIQSVFSIGFEFVTLPKELLITPNGHKIRYAKFHRSGMRSYIWRRDNRNERPSTNSKSF